MRHAASALASACGIGIGMRHRHAASIFDFMISKSEKSYQLALDLQSYKIKIQTLVIIQSLNKILLKVSKITLICYFADLQHVLTTADNRYHFIETMHLFKLDLSIRRVYLHYIVLELCNCPVINLSFCSRKTVNVNTSLNLFKSTGWPVTVTR